MNEKFSLFGNKKVLVMVSDGKTINQQLPYVAQIRSFVSNNTINTMFLSKKDKKTWKFLA
jgi:hypothetical protein